MYPNSCYRDPTFRCEEHSCRTNWYDFPCGDGQCVQKFNKCHNGCHHLLIQSINNQQNKSNKCYIAMMCLTKLVKQVHGILCETLFINYLINLFIQSCEKIFEFPLNPVHMGHIRFLYENHSLKTNLNPLIIPDYVCYDDELCDCIEGRFI